MQKFKFLYIPICDENLGSYLHKIVSLVSEKHITYQILVKV